MPLEIRELVIKVEVQENIQLPPAEINGRFEELKSKLIEDCVKKVLNRLENNSSR